MKFEKQLSSLMTAALLCGTFTTLSSGQQTAPAGGAVADSIRLRLQPMPPCSSRRLRSPRMPCVRATSAS